MEELVEYIREMPTVPGDPSDAKEPWKRALGENEAVLLPKKHCAFKGCAWKGRSDEELQAHLAQRHWSVLSPLAEMLSGFYPEVDRLWSVYLELLATKAARVARPHVCTCEHVYLLTGSQNRYTTWFC
jgi:hypothetical protein